MFDRDWNELAKFHHRKEEISDIKFSPSKAPFLRCSICTTQYCLQVLDRYIVMYIVVLLGLGKACD